MLFRSAWLASLAALSFTSAQNNSVREWPIKDNGLSKLVQWDHYSLLVNGERLFFFAGEFHYWRIPVPELWKDILEKIKAAGFTGFSIYNYWAYHSPADGVLDWSNGAHDFSTIMKYAKEVGIWMQIRPGPYINAETSGGGFPSWLLSGAYGKLRRNDTAYTKAWTPYFSELSRIVAPHTVDNGGNVIIFQVENEFAQWKNVTTRTLNVEQSAYMDLLQDCARENGIKIPLMANDGGMTAYSWSYDFSDSIGNVDITALDSYPSCWYCNTSECNNANGPYVPTHLQSYWPYFNVNTPTQPSFFAEFQGGSNLVWGLPGGQQECNTHSDAEFVNIVYRNNIANRVTAMSLYMIYGGTNWGYTGMPRATTTYDYAAAISENRQIADKYSEMKLFGLMIRAVKDLRKTDFGNNGTQLTSNPNIIATELRNPDTKAGFYVVKHIDSPSPSHESFTLSVNTSAGPMVVPRLGSSIAINGRQAKVIPIDFKYGSKNLLYSTAEILTLAIIDGKEVLVLWVPTGEAAEFVIEGTISAKNSLCEGCANLKVSSEDSSSVTISLLQNRGTTIFTLGDGSRVVVLDRQAAYKTWAPVLSNNPMTPEDETVLVQGPHLVRSAAVSADGKTLNLVGDLEGDGTITVIASSSVTSVTWNGHQVSVSKGKGDTLVGPVKGPETFNLPKLGSWKWQDGLPEIAADYKADGRAWVVANHTNTTLATKPATNNPVLYPDDYGFYQGVSLYRATFASKPCIQPAAVSLTLSGGAAFGYSAWLNGQHIGSFPGTYDITIHTSNFSLPKSALQPRRSGKPNVLLIAMDNTGHEQQSQMPPRGITNATLLFANGTVGPSFTEWRIAGNAGGIRNIDPVRGPLNEGGLVAERVGMVQPGYPGAAEWTAVPESNAALSVPGAGMRVFRTSWPLHVPNGHDVSVSFRMTAPVPSRNPNVNTTFGFESAEGRTDELRALLYVNGYQFGKFYPFIGTQFDYPVPPGILDYDGENTIAVVVWSQSDKGAEIKIELVLNYIHESGFDFKFDGRYLRPEWKEERLQYA